MPTPRAPLPPIGGAGHTTDRVVLYGPPGAGKSTKVLLVLARGVPALDLEWYSAELRPQVAENASKTRSFFVIGAADQKVELMRTLFPDYLHVLVLPPPDVYRQRRAERDAALPHKAGQADVYDGFAAGAAKFDRTDNH